MRSVALALLVAVLAVAATGCGGDESTSSAEEWVDAFCTAALDWQNEIESLAEEASDLSALSTDDVRTLGEDADAATDEFIDEVRELGAPDTESGEEIDQAADELTNTVEAEKEEIREAVEDVDDITEFGTAVATVTTSFGQMGTELGEMLETIGSAEADDELRTAYEDSEACDELREDE
jgi:methyl-accepting chemotaxis protein